jgi:3,4-dihydroxy 2-butanone 4-phosphate synthase
MLAAPVVRPVPGVLRPAARALADGEPVLIFDAPDRERETDLVVLSEKMTPELVHLARRDAGGFICTAISDELRRRLELPFASDLLEVGRDRYPTAARLAERPRYDKRSAFGITVNHRENYTGISDNERSLTIRSVGELARQAPRLTDAGLRSSFVASFISPGHVPLIYAAPGLLHERKGHTDLVISLARMAGLSESVTVCEMLGDSGGARDLGAARRYAEAHGFPFLTGAELVEAWKAWSSA